MREAGAHTTFWVTSPPMPDHRNAGGDPTPISRHVMGTARMGTDRGSVCDQYQRLWDVDNVLVSDSSVFHLDRLRTDADDRGARLACRRGSWPTYAGCDPGHAAPRRGTRVQPPVLAGRQVAKGSRTATATTVRGQSTPGNGLQCRVEPGHEGARCTGGRGNARQRSGVWER